MRAETQAEVSEHEEQDQRQQVVLALLAAPVCGGLFRPFEESWPGIKNFI